MVCHHQKGGECWNLSFTLSSSSWFDDSKHYGTNNFFEWFHVVTIRVQHQGTKFMSFLFSWWFGVLNISWKLYLKTLIEDLWRLFEDFVYLSVFCVLEMYWALKWRNSLLDLSSQLDSSQLSCWLFFWILKFFSSIFKSSEFGLCLPFLSQLFIVTYFWKKFSMSFVPLITT